MPLRQTAAFASLALAAAAAAALGDTVQLPYQTSDNNGNQWMVYMQGSLQQQGNQPVFQQAAMITVNGQQGMLNNQSANFDPKTGTLTLNFNNRNGGALRQTRQIRFDDNSPVVRVIDILENQGGNEASANVQLTTMTNFGINDAGMVTDPKNKGAEIGWVANTGANRAAMSLYASKGSKVLPKLRYRQGTNSVVAQFQTKVPANGKIAIVSWHGGFDTSDAAQQWAAGFNERKDLGDVPAELRKQIINLGGGGSDFVAGRELLRGSTNDVIELVGGDQMRGDLKPAGYTLATSYGTIKLPTDKVTGILSVGGYQPRQLVITGDGEIFGGSLQEPALPLQLASGQTTSVPYAQIARVGCRLPNGGNGDAPAWKLDGPMVFLADGERCKIDLPAEPINVVTRYGELKLQANQISTILLSPDAETQTFYLADGSRLSGVLDRQDWPLKLTTVQGDAPTSFPIATLSRVQFSVLPDGVGSGQPTVALLGSDIVSARITGQLKLVTTFDTLTLDAGQLRGINRPDLGQPDVQVTMFDGSTFRGRLDTPTLSLQLSAGPTLQVPVASIRDYQNPRPLPAQSIVDKANDAIKQLNADDWKQREQAEAGLVGMGDAIIPVLQDAQKEQPPESRERITAIIAKLKKDQPATPSRLSPPPALN